MTTKKLEDIIKAKKRVFSDFSIPWDEEIESKFKREMERNPYADPELILDRMTHDAILHRLATM